MGRLTSLASVVSAVSQFYLINHSEMQTRLVIIEG